MEAEVALTDNEDLGDEDLTIEDDDDEVSPPDPDDDLSCGPKDNDSRKQFQQCSFWMEGVMLCVTGRKSTHSLNTFVLVGHFVILSLVLSF